MCFRYFQFKLDLVYFFINWTVKSVKIIKRKKNSCSPFVREYLRLWKTLFFSSKYLRFFCSARKHYGTKPGWDNSIKHLATHTVPRMYVVSMLDSSACCCSVPYVMRQGFFFCISNSFCESLILCLIYCYCLKFRNKTILKKALSYITRCH